MTSYRLFPSASGPSAANTVTGGFTSAVGFAVAGGGLWFTGYWWWCCASGQSTAPVACALWSVASASGGQVVPGSTVTSGTLTPGQWNFIPLPAPVQLSPTLDAASTAAGSMYVAAVASTALNSGVPLTSSQFGSGQPLAAGVASGPLTAFSDFGASRPPPFMNQGLFKSGASVIDPAATFPNSQSNSSNFWVDVAISDAAPAGYAGSYRLWPNHVSVSKPTVLDSAVAYSVATEVRLSKPCTLNKIWYYSPSGAASLATSARVWQVTGANSGTSVAAVSSPAWSGAAGSGWVSCPVSGVTLPAGTYKVSVYNSAGGSGGWSAKDAASSYWASGSGAGGITWGPLYAPQLASASPAYEYNGNAGGTPPYSNGTAEPGQSTFAQSSDVYPYLYVDGLAQNYWADMEVTPVPVSGTGSASLSLSASGAGAAQRSGTGTALLSLSAAAARVLPVLDPALLSAVITAREFGGTIT